jgi:hypothetical protein
MSIEVKEIPIKAYHSVGKIERVYTMLKQAYSIFLKELTLGSRELILQIVIKVCNNTPGANGLSPTLIIFRTYPRINKNSLLALSITEKIEVMRLAIKVLRKYNSKHIVADALGMRNGPNTSAIQNLPLLSKVLVWRENK